MPSSSQRNYLKDWFFTVLTIRTRKTNIHEANFVIVTDDLETSNPKTESGIGERQEAIDDFIKKKKVQTQIRWLLIWTLFSTNCKATVWQMKELKPYLQRSLTIPCPLKFFMNKRAGNTNKRTSQDLKELKPFLQRSLTISCPLKSLWTNAQETRTRVQASNNFQFSAQNCAKWKEASNCYRERRGGLTLLRLSITCEL